MQASEIYAAEFRLLYRSYSTFLCRVHGMPQIAHSAAALYVYAQAKICTKTTLAVTTWVFESASIFVVINENLYHVLSDSAWHQG